MTSRKPANYLMGGFRVSKQSSRQIKLIVICAIILCFIMTLTACENVHDSDMSAPLVTTQVQTQSVCEHNGSEWIVDSEATLFADGKRHQECLMCGEHLQDEIIPKIECSHSETSWITDRFPILCEDGEKHEECTVCGKVLAQEAIPYGLEMVDACYGMTYIQNQDGKYLSYNGKELVATTTPTEWFLSSCGDGRFYIKDSSDFLAMEYYGGILKMEEDTGYTEQQWVLKANDSGGIVIEHADSKDNYLRSNGDGTLSVVHKSVSDDSCIWSFQIDALSSGHPYFEIIGKSGIVSLRIEHRVLDWISYDRLQQWADNLERAYEAYAELTGWTPFKRVEVRGYTNCNGWGYVYREKPVIHVNKDCLYEDLMKMKRRENDWNFGVLHEMSHLFDRESWAFEWEALAHYKVAYVLYKFDAYAAPAEFPAEQLFSHETLKNAFVQLDGTLEENRGSIQKPLAVKLWEITDKAGWDAVVQTFAVMQKTNDNSQIEKLDRFLSLIGEYGSLDAVAMFSELERGILAHSLS